MSTSSIALPESRRGGDLVFITRHLVPYWAEALDELAKCWTQFGSLHVLCSKAGDDDLHPWTSDSSFPKFATTKIFPEIPRFRLLSTVWPPRQMWDYLQSVQPRLVIIHEYSPYVILSGMLWAFAAGRPCVVTSDVGPSQRLQLSLMQRLVHHVVNGAVEGVLARTEDAMNSAKMSHRIGLLAPHAIAVDFYQTRRDPNRTPNTIIQVGSLIHRKGYDLLMRAFQAAHQERPDIRLKLVGAGNHKAALDLARDLGIEDCVSIFDFLPASELRRHYAESDVFVLASRFDSFGVVVHEAAASGLPLILSKHVGAAATLVERDANGCLVDPENIGEFSRAILNVLDPGVNRLMSEASAQIAKNFDLAVVAEQTAAWLRQISTISPLSNPAEKPTPARGIWRLLGRSLQGQWSAVEAVLVPDAFTTHRRDVVVINRYAPFYRQGIFSRLSEHFSLRILYSGKTLGNLKSVESVESVAVPVLESRHGKVRKIYWLGTTFQLMLTRPSVVITEFSLSLFSTWMLFLLRPLLRFRLVFWAHGLQDYGWKNSKLSRGDRLRLLWMHWADAMVFYSQDRMQEVVPMVNNPAKLFVAPNAVDTDELLDAYRTVAREGKVALRKHLDLAGVVLVYVGRLTQDKAVLDLPPLMESLAAHGVSATLLVVGGGELDHELRDRCHHLGDAVRFLGPVFDPLERSRIVYASDIMISPGYVGLNVVDSLSMGRPVATLSDSSLKKRHSPEFCYLSEGFNAIVAPSISALGGRLAKYFSTGEGVSGSESRIQKQFAAQCSIDRQLAGLKQAISYLTIQ